MTDLSQVPLNCVGVITIVSMTSFSSSRAVRYFSIFIRMNSKDIRRHDLLVVGFRLGFSIATHVVCF